MSQPSKVIRFERSDESGKPVVIERTPVPEIECTIEYARGATLRAISDEALSFYNDVVDVDYRQKLVLDAITRAMNVFRIFARKSLFELFPGDEIFVFQQIHKYRQPVDSINNDGKSVARIEQARDTDNHSAIPRPQPISDESDVGLSECS